MWKETYFLQGEKSSGLKHQYPTRAKFKCIQAPRGQAVVLETAIGSFVHFWNPRHCVAMSSPLNEEELGETSSVEGTSEHHADEEASAIASDVQSSQPPPSSDEDVPSKKKKNKSKSNQGGTKKREGNMRPSIGESPTAAEYLVAMNSDVDESTPNGHGDDAASSAAELEHVFADSPAADEDDLMGEIPVPPASGGGTAHTPAPPRGAIAQGSDLYASDAEGDASQRLGGGTTTGHASAYRADNYIFECSQVAEWMTELDDINSSSRLVGSNSDVRRGTLRGTFCAFLEELDRKYFDVTNMEVRHLSQLDRAATFMGIALNCNRDYNWEMFHTRQGYVRSTYDMMVLLTYKLQIIQPLNDLHRSERDKRCEITMDNLSRMIENSTLLIGATWQSLYLNQGQVIDDPGLPRSMQNWHCSAMTQPSQQYLHYLKTCILQNNLKITAKTHEVYAPIHVWIDKRFVSTRYYIPLRMACGGAIVTIGDIVALFSSKMSETQGLFENPKKLFLRWNSHHASRLREDITNDGKGKGVRLHNELTQHLKNDITGRFDIMPKGEIWYSFTNGVIRVTPTLLYRSYNDIPADMRSFQFIDQPLRPDVIACVEAAENLQIQFDAKEIDAQEFLTQTLNIVAGLRKLSPHFESCFDYQEWTDGTKNAYYACVLPQMIARRQWNHSNQQILDGEFPEQANGLMVILVGITGSGKSALIDLLGIAVPDQHRIQMSIGGGQKDFQLTMLNDKPTAMMIEMPDARESLRNLSKEALLQMTGGSNYSITCKYDKPLEIRGNRCIGIIAATNNQVVEITKDEFSDARSSNASERRTFVLILNNTHVGTTGATHDIKKFLRSEIDSYIAVSFLLFGSMRQLFPDKEIYDMICGKVDPFKDIFGTQIAEFRRDINNVGDTFRNIFLMQGIFISRANNANREEDDVLCVPLSVLTAIINNRLQKEGEKKKNVFSGTIKTYLDRIFNVDADAPTVHIERRPLFLWRGKEYKDDDIVFGITISFIESKRPFCDDEFLTNLEEYKPAVHKEAIANINMHLRLLCEYEDPLEVFITKNIMKNFHYIPNSMHADAQTTSGDRYHGFGYDVLVDAWQRWCERTCFVGAAKTVGNLFGPENIERIEKIFHTAGWTDVVIRGRKIMCPNGGTTDIIFVRNILLPVSADTGSRSSGVGTRGSRSSTPRKRQASTAASHESEGNQTDGDGFSIPNPPRKKTAGAKPTAVVNAPANALSATLPVNQLHPEQVLQLGECVTPVPRVQAVQIGSSTVPTEVARGRGRCGTAAPIPNAATTPEKKGSKTATPPEKNGSKAAQNRKQPPKKRGRPMKKSVEEEFVEEEYVEEGSIADSSIADSSIADSLRGSNRY